MLGGGVVARRIEPAVHVPPLVGLHPAPVVLHLEQASGRGVVPPRLGCLDVGRRLARLRQPCTRTSTPGELDATIGRLLRVTEGSREGRGGGGSETDGGREGRDSERAGERVIWPAMMNAAGAVVGWLAAHTPAWRPPTRARSGCTCAKRLSYRGLIEAPWLVNGGHGASLRQPSGLPWVLRGIVGVADDADGVETVPEAESQRRLPRHGQSSAHTVAQA
eukprot:COSAG01_NODE_8809_length_2652_cov_1.596161_1_plen_220_part_00